MKKCLILVIVFLLSITGFSQSVEKTIYIAPEQTKCMGVGPMDCMQVKWSNDGEWQLFYEQIDGFTFEKGYNYKLLIKEEKVENPPADASNVKYTLVKVISKEKAKLSEGKKPFTSTHIFTAKYTGTYFHICKGRTANCPKHCGNSGNMANFKVLKYKKFEVNGESGTEKLNDYQIQISDYNKKDFNKAYVATIKKLKKGDIVTIHLEVVYDTTKDFVAPEWKIISVKKKK